MWVSGYNFPDVIYLIGIPYRVEYLVNPLDVDREKRESYWGQIDHWTQTIRVFVKGRSKEAIFETLLHEVLHGLSGLLKLKNLDDEDTISRLSISLADVLTRHGFVRLESGPGEEPVQEP